MNSAAIIHTGGIGDFIQTFPVLAAMRRKWPEARITLLGHGDRTRLAVVGGLADAAVDFETSSAHRLFAPEAGEADVPDVLGRADLILNFLAHPVFNKNVAHLTAARVLAVRGFPEPGSPCDRSAAQFVYDQVAGPLGLPAAEAVPRLALPDDLPEARDVASRFPRAAEAVAIHPGSGSPDKNWPLARFARLSERLARQQVEVVWLLGPAELDSEAFSAVAGSRRRVAPAGIVSLACFVKRVRGYVGNDSGPTHLAAALGTATVALFGPSDPVVWGPRGPHVRTLRGASGRMPGIATEDVFGALGDLIDFRTHSAPP